MEIPLENDTVHESYNRKQVDRLSFIVIFELTRTIFLNRRNKAIYSFITQIRWSPFLCQLSAINCPILKYFFFTLPAQAYWREQWSWTNVLLWQRRSLWILVRQSAERQAGHLLVGIWLLLSSWKVIVNC